MAKNIKEIGKELMGKSLNSFHRKTGLTQLEENNKMQDGILDGILSQVDDAYIEKTEQSNVMHLDGSGDGVVVLDSIEGNTMVNCSLDFNQYTINSNPSNPNQHLRVSKNKNNFIYKENTVYTICVNVVENTIMGYSCINVIDNYKCIYNQVLKIKAGETGIFKLKITTKQGDNFINATEGFNSLVYQPNGEDISGRLVVKNIMILEGDWTNREIPQYFEGLQSSFEEKANNEGKYEIEILMKNENVFNYNNFKHNTHSTGVLNSFKDGVVNLNSGVNNGGFYYTINKDYIDTSRDITFSTDVLSVTKSGRFGIHCRQKGFGTTYGTTTIYGSGVYSVTIPANTIKDDFMFLVYAPATNTTNDNIVFKNMTISYTNVANPMPHKSNKIKLLINEPLRAIDTIKDKLCVKDNRLVIERNCGEVIFNGSEDWRVNHKMTNNTAFWTKNIPNVSNIKIPISDKFKQLSHHLIDEQGTFTGTKGTLYLTHSSSSIEELKVWLQSNLTTMVFPLAEPYYEEVLNEYGEPIILEGYENGTIYIDSTIVPTTSVRYTPKMQSFKTLKEVENNNIMLTNDVNDNIIPYMMDVDFMIMEKEMALMSHKNIRKMEVLDMTSMQKRTQDMLERLIKGKTLTEQECKTRVTTYLNAGKITDAQAEELNFLIDEIYA